MNGFGAGLGRDFGGRYTFWWPLGVLGPHLCDLLALFFGACIWNARWKGSWRLPGSIWSGFERVLEGFGEGLGARKPSKIRDFSCSGGYAFRDLHFCRVLLNV